MEIDVSFDEDFKDCPDAVWLQGIAQAVLNAENAGGSTEMGLVITGQQQIRQLNKTYRHIDSATDVLSFPMHEGEDAELAITPDGVKHLGEVIISYLQAVKQAAEHGHSPKKEMAVLITHGVLHLLGYDHIEDEEAEIMEARERQILQEIQGKIE